MVCGQGSGNRNFGLSVAGSSSLARSEYEKWYLYHLDLNSAQCRDRKPIPESGVWPGKWKRVCVGGCQTSTSPLGVTRTYLLTVWPNFLEVSMQKYLFINAVTASIDHPTKQLSPCQIQRLQAIPPHFTLDYHREKACRPKPKKLC